MRRGGRRVTYSRNELALAYELRAAGVAWKLIGYGLGCGEDALRKACRKAEREGIA